MSEAERTVAFFDFDGTLATGDSLFPFLLAARGWRLCLLGMFLGMIDYFLLPPDQDRRTAFKTRLLRVILEGVRLETLGAAIKKMRDYPEWIDQTVAALMEHHAKGHVIVIATGSLGLYVPAMVRDVLPYDDILATEMEVVDGVLTGEMILGNCVRLRKAQRVAEYIAENGPFIDSWAYGNVPNDLPMMEVVKHRVVI